MRWISLAVLLACGKPPAPAPLAPDAGVVDACATIRALQRVALAQPRACVLDAKSRRNVELCVRTRDGAWGLLVEPMRSARTADCREIADAVEFGMAGSVMSVARAAYADARGRVFRGPPFEWRSVGDLRTFDYDGDGLPELLVSGTRDEDGGLVQVDPRYQGFGVVWRAASADVEAYAPTATLAIESFADVDSDGRPDLVTRARIEGSDGDVSSWYFFGPERVGHSLGGGGFSFDDGVSSARLARDCAGATLATASARSLFEAALCARAAGQPAERIERDWVARCRDLARHATPMGVFHEGYDAGVSLVAVCRADFRSLDRVAMPRAVADALN